MLQAKSLKTRSGVSFGFFVGLDMFVQQRDNASVMAVNITYKKFPPIFEIFRILSFKPPVFQKTHIHLV